MSSEYKLIGFLNLFNIVPDFVLPVFEFNGELFFQEGKMDTIESFSRAKPAIRTRIIPIDSNSNNNHNVLFDLSSKPVYAFETTDKQVVYGNSSFFRQFFQTYIPENEVLALEINDFLESLPVQEKNEIVLYVPTLYQPKVATYYGTGRRKTSTARVYICQGNGNIVINGRDIDNYFGLQNLKLVACQPLRLTDNLQNFDVRCVVSGGGVTGQAGAISLGIARALLQYNIELRPSLKSAGLLTRDARMKERKKYGLKAARKASQFSKR